MPQKKPTWPKCETGAVAKKQCLICGDSIKPGELYDFIKSKGGAVSYLHNECRPGR